MKLTPFITAACCLTFLHYPLASASDLPHRFTFTEGSWIEHWNTPWQARLGSTQVVATPKAPGSDQSLLISYPKGAVGPEEGGVQFPIVLDGIEGFEAYYSSLTLDYCLKFKPGFDFVKGGKLPGLMGSEGAWARSGGDQPDGSNGWTLRYMWRQNGRAVVYAYLPPSPNGRYGNEQWGQDIELGKSFVPGRWHCLKQSVKVNDMGEENGELHVWFDGEKVLSRTDISYRLADTTAGLVGGIYVSTFHGGNTPDWGPSRDSHLLLNDLRLSH
ncbi:polysaccharide lyase [Gilvimarinus xylanilyticus]|uniref:Polysaccharide lyase 14 domain-containing protein n=1 Tax=Gilvimarinus xylanilyticus TaxID=2944139 RepID=A0A9X2KVL1_9GAMM|nr:hypothetical protein [Gilvimarinus xylanilyticus]MCP8898155.1 hypothetical protein [Gilvimarinus xylanilyticus]